MVKVRSRKGQDIDKKVKKRLMQGQSKAKVRSRQGLSKTKVMLKQYNKDHNCNFFDGV